MRKWNNSKFLIFALVISLLLNVGYWLGDNITTKASIEIYQSQYDILLEQVNNNQKLIGELIEKPMLTLEDRDMRILNDRISDMIVTSKTVSLQGLQTFRNRAYSFEMVFLQLQTDFQFIYLAQTDELLKQSLESYSKKLGLVHSELQTIKPNSRYNPNYIEFNTKSADLGDRLTKMQ